MKKNVFLLLMFTIAFISVNGANLSTNQNSPGDSTTIEFNKTIHDYGTIKKGSDGSYTFTFTNTGNVPLVLTNVRSSCGCAVPTWPKEPITPGKTGEIKVSYNTGRVGTFHKSVTVTSNAKTVVLTIEGAVQE